ncbi:MAG TPA: hypothetical protein VHT30_10940 [Acidimicrobiales bacterium]|nr:hypothetical protein [Acidimicrobiales bacterium]
MITRRRVVVSLILATCFALFIWSFSLVRPTNTPVVFKNSAVKAVSPTVGALVLRESSVAITLAPGYNLASQNIDGLSISADGAATGIPTDEIQITPAQNQYSFLPTGGSVLSELPVGRVCAIAEILSTNNPSGAPQSFSWCFQTQ